ncbi:uncharacterized protein Dwil_GK19205 [Drosophila willistoni]|uniref:Uncharacterized protein n=1 Tax=Drosophila willistoni TaxID=7260 RepID=B4NBA0_DROWI|nr:uncharacterized protein LOC6647103 [Drosophila willistoni]EDW81064.1 uncharacterized protein Dwil_GK19205 [Drosophila willistoni]
MDVKWNRTWKRLVREHFKNQVKIQRLHHELQRFQNKHNRIQRNIDNEVHDYEYKVQLLNNLRTELDNYVERNKRKLSSTKRETIKKLREILPGDSLAKQVKQMELFATKMDSTQGQETTSEARVSLAQVKTKPAVEKRLARIEADRKALERINHRTFVAMNDIRQLQFTLRYLKRSQCNKLKVNPYIDRTNWLEVTAKPEAKNISATIALKCLQKSNKNNKNIVTKQILDVRPPFILKNIPELMPDRYHYLNKTEMDNK